MLSRLSLFFLFFCGLYVVKVWVGCTMYMFALIGVEFGTQPKFKSSLTS